MSESSKGVTISKPPIVVRTFRSIASLVMYPSTSLSWSWSSPSSISGGMLVILLQSGVNVSAVVRIEFPETDDPRYRSKGLLETIFSTSDSKRTVSISKEHSQVESD